MSATQGTKARSQKLVLSMSKRSLMSATRVAKANPPHIEAVADVNDIEVAKASPPHIEVILDVNDTEVMNASPPRIKAVADVNDAKVAKASPPHIQTGQMSVTQIGHEARSQKPVLHISKWSWMLKMQRWQKPVLQTSKRSQISVTQGVKARSQKSVLHISKRS